MFIGHIATGLAAKRFAPRTSLGTLMLAALFADLLCSIFFAVGIEHAAIRPGITAVNPLDLYDFPLSHSLVANALCGALLAAAYFLICRNPRGAWVLFALVPGHWLLDFVSHRPDMPLAPGVPKYFGLGLWNSVAATFVVEGLLWFIAIVLYVRATRPKGRAGVYAFWGVIALMTLLWVLSLSSPAPSSIPVVAVTNLILFAAALAWAYWMNRARREIS